MKPEVVKWMADIDAFTREKTGMPESWRVHRYEHIGRGDHGTHYRFTGNMLAEQTEMFRPTWSRDPTTERVIVASYAEFDAWVAKRDGKDGDQ